ncbi:MAG: class I SAM-dependent methyltransferase [Solirubrobacterales bacterium]
MSLRWAPVDSGPRGFTAPALTTHRPCPVCGSLAARPFLELPEYQFYTDDPHLPKRATVRDVQCESCFAAFLNPVYTDTGFQILFAEAEKSYGATEGHMAEQLEWMGERGLLTESTGTAVLDVGCYDGGLLALMPEGVRLLGVDIDPQAIERGRQRLGDAAELVHGDFESFQISTTPDLILMFHVLEHLPRPVAALAALRAVAHADTKLVIEVPVLEGRPTNDVVGFFTIQHTTHFSRRSLTNCLARAGWRIVESACHLDYNGERVLCEPAEPQAGTVGDPEDVVRLREAIVRWQRAAIDVARATTPLAQADRCVIWGGGAHIEHIYATTPFFQVRPQREYVIVDSDETKQGRTWRGIGIHSPEALADPSAAGVPLLVSSYGSQPEIVRAAAERGVEPERIVTLYESVSSY